MKNLIEFRDFAGFDHIRHFIETALAQSLEKFESHRLIETHVVLGTTRARTDAHQPIFVCDLIINANGAFPTIVVKKENQDFYKAIRESIRTAEKVLRRESKFRMTKQRNSGVTNVLTDATA